jgi:nitric oxide synthase oxygenase domain/subunit
MSSKHSKSLIWSNKKINYQDYDSKIEQVIEEPIEEDLKKICNELSFK